MSWHFVLAAAAERDLDRLDADIATRVRERLSWFIEHFEETTHYPLTAELRGLLKLRAGDWRLVYRIDNAARIVYITGVEHRSKAYKKRR